MAEESASFSVVRFEVHIDVVVSGMQDIDWEWHCAVPH